MKRIKVWDLPIRIFHWSLVILMVTCLYTSYNLSQYWTFLKWFGIEREVSGLLAHQYAGVGIFILLIFRIIWGFIGSSHARFSDFLRGPKTILNYLKTNVAPTEGHNPLGGYMVLAMIVVFLTQVTTGLFLEDNSYYLAGNAPLASLIDGVSVTIADKTESLRSLFKSIHVYGRYVIFGLIGLHLLAILAYTLMKHRLVGAMVTGTRKFDHGDDPEASRLRYDHPLVGLLLLAIIAAIVIYLLYYR